MKEFSFKHLITQFNLNWDIQNLYNIYENAENTLFCFQ